ncbi:transglutaminase domain-containing protein [Mycoplasma sp. 06067-C1-B144P-99-0482-3]|uniref:MAG6410 family transglutaminase-related lipoprotein n=1 Tax=Mycoplasma sp. 06067-C1-B144P-99-0482-3 TaxID=3117438 RepID=UPI003DA1E8A1
MKFLLKLLSIVGSSSLGLTTLSTNYIWKQNNANFSSNNTNIPTNNASDKNKYDESNNINHQDLIDNDSKNDTQATPFSDGINKPTYNQPLINVIHPQQHVEPFLPSNNDFQTIKDKILDTKKTTYNYYSHPNFKIIGNDAPLNSKTQNKLNLKLVDQNNEVVQGVNWYLKDNYSPQEVYKSNTDYEGRVLQLDDDGTLTGLKFNSPDTKNIEIWAEHKGYLFRNVVTVLSEFTSTAKEQEQGALDEVKKITQGWEKYSDYEKILKTYQWITKNINYVERFDSFAADQTAYAGIIEKEAVCTGYTMSFKMFMDHLGIPNKAIEGVVGGVKHIWNLVELDDGWYHIDSTWGRMQGKDKIGLTNYNWFLLNNDDFGSGREFIHPTQNMGTKYRFSKARNFITSLKNVEKIIEKSRLENPDSKVISFQYYGNSIKIEELKKFITDNLNLQIQRDKTEINRNLNRATFEFKNNIKPISQNQMQLTVTAEQNRLKIEGLKDGVTLDANNFDIAGASIRKIENNSNATYVQLGNFNEIGIAKVKVSIFKNGHNFDIKEKEFNFNVSRNNKPNAYLEGVDNESVVLKGVNNIMQYRSLYDEWKDVGDRTEIKLDNVGAKFISVRVKPTDAKEASEVQVIHTTKPADLDIKVKYYNGDIIGVDPSMQYRIVGTNNWVDIIGIKIEKPSRGSYEIRVKPQKNSLASDYKIITIN